jgi:hypothetical protein
VPPILKVEPGPDEILPVPGMVVVVPSGLVHVSLGIAAVTARGPTVRFPKKPEPPCKGALAISCAGAADFWRISPGDSVQPLEGVKVLVIVVSMVPV